MIEQGQTFEEWILDRVADLRRQRDAELDAEAYRRIPERTPDAWGDPPAHLVAGARSTVVVAAKAEDWG